MKKSYISIPALMRKIIFSFTLLFLLMGPFKIAEAQIVELDDMIIAPAPDLGDVCKLPPTGTDAHYFRSAERMQARYNTMANVRTAEFEIDYVSSCNGQSWPQQAQNAFEYALDVWASHLDSSVPIRIRADWASLQCDQDGCTLGSAGPTIIVRDFSGSVPNTFYTIAQASAMTGRDIVEETQGTQNEVNHDIVINMNCNYNNWYFGTDANTPTGQVDFVTVTLHEVGHGIGFIGSMGGDEDTESAGYRSDNIPYIYDRFAEDGDETSLLNTNTYPNPSNDLYRALTGQRGGIFHNGNDARSVYSGQRIPLFAPNPWNPGSSYSHVNQATFSQTENALMRPQIENAFALHSPGPVFCGMMSDWGWPLGANCLALVGAEAVIAVNENMLDFGVTNVGTPVERTFIITNEETAEDPLSYNLTIDSDNFTIFPAGETSGSLEPGQSTEVTVRYNPQIDRVHESEVRISHNASNASSPLLILLEAESLQQGEVARLEQNYPNPFNPTTTIPFVLPEDSNVRVDIYNISGQHIQTLVNGFRESNRYDEPFDGSSLASGVYIYRLIVNDFVDTRKFLIVK